ncbi:MazG family protein [Propionibacterium sp.]|uniref:MazG family protein n=1 Tax=Propionibacterium sp. TaxID=1977903 RepID=UPI0039E833DC
MSEAREGEAAPGHQLTRLVEVMTRLRRECPWDARQTHRSLVKHLVEECAETVDAIEVGSPEDLREELGDVLMQVVFHSLLAREDGLFGIDDVADSASAKLIARHPYVYKGAELPSDLDASWELRKRAAKHRNSCLDGIAGSLPALAKAAKVAQREHNGGPDEGSADAEPITAEQAGEQILAIVRRAEASGVDVDQATRDAVRSWERRIHRLERDQRSV